MGIRPIIGFSSAKRKRTARREQNTFQSLDALPEHIAILDGRAEIVAVNEAWMAFARQNGGDPAKVGVGSGYLEACQAAGDCPDAASFAAGLRLVLLGKQPRFSLTYPCHSSSEEHWFLGRISRWSGTAPDRIVISHVDITARARVEAELVEARKEIAVVGETRETFLSNLSHELRTPLNAVLGWASQLRCEPGAVQALQEGLEAIERNAKNLDRLVAELLALSGMATGRTKLHLCTLDLREVVSTAIAAIRPMAQAKRIRIAYRASPTPVWALADQNRLQQVLWSVLVNAAKFAPPHGKIVVQSRSTNRRVQIRICDNGSGIKPELLPYVFDRFWQADRSLTRQHRGLGIGLALVRELVELHGGTVRAESRGERLGMTVTIALPSAPGLVQSREVDDEREMAGVFRHASCTKEARSPPDRALEEGALLPKRDAYSGPGFFSIDGFNSNKESCAMNIQTTDKNATERLGQAIRTLLVEAREEDHQERRSEPRHPFFRPVSVQFKDGKRRSFSAFTREISASGIGLLHNIELQPGEVQIAIRTQEGHLMKLRTRIVWCRPCGEGWYLSGGQFLSVDVVSRS